MELKDNCTICMMDMRRKPVVRLLPCGHLLHAKCSGPVIVEEKCPICRGDIEDNEVLEKTRYRKYNNVDRLRIVEAANKGEDWCSLAASLDIVYKTAYTWVQSGRVVTQKRGGGNEKKLNENDVAVMVRWVEEDCTVTLKQLVSKVETEFNKHICTSTAANYLEGKLFTLKSMHHMPATMNTLENKQKRSEFVTALSGFIQQGKQIVYIDETNFNLFCRRAKGRARSGTRAAVLLPPSRGPNVHLIGAVSVAGVLSMETRRGSFKKESAGEWVKGILEKWTDLGNNLADLVIVCDNAPCHAGLEQVVANNGSATLLRLGPYSPMLNPIENVWAKTKSYVKTHISLPAVNGPGVVERRLQYLEDLIHQAKETITTTDCARAIQHSSIFFSDALALRDMPVGM